MPNGGTYKKTTRLRSEQWQSGRRLFFLGHWLMTEGFDLSRPIERRIDFDTLDFIFEQDIE